ncbi:MAG: NAD(P)-dependent glycerol-3-phosphate dehydrogenase [Planctomycetota bacterium]|nr:MAG: NAD(P)-dependent glycerol-3-phosphate dehydrogenase [Planctomycetota bacterium]
MRRPGPQGGDGIDRRPACALLSPMHTIAVIGTGTWGCALASLLHSTGAEVLLWGRRQDMVDQLCEQRRHPRLGEHPLPPDLPMSADAEALGSAETLIWAVPTQHSRRVAQQLQPHLQTCQRVVSVSKGLEQGSLLRISQILAECLPAHDFWCLSGPSHAEEVIGGHPAGLVLAGSGPQGSELQQLLNRTPLRVYLGHDVLGVELAGALKNVIAIAAGCVDALNLGDNVKATLVTRGLAELRRLGRAAGCHEQTFAGLAGIGDLLTTCYSRHGRNRALGQALALGRSLEDFCTQTGTVPEGAWTAEAAVRLGERLAVELPIASQVASLLRGDTTVDQAITGLLAREAREEDL